MTAAPRKSGLESRSRAVAALDGVLRRHEPIGEHALDGLDIQERAFSHALVSASLRRKGEAEAVLAAFLARPLPKSSGTARAILLSGAAQLLFMRVAAHAAIDLSVTLARADSGARHFAGLINAVLRKVASQGPGLLAGLDAAQLNTPGWLWRRWSRTFGEDRARAIAEAHAHAPSLDISVKPGRAGPCGELLPTGSVRIDHHGRIEDLAGYAAGDWWVQDAAAALPVKLLGEVAGKRVLVLCAAPGGKTAQLAAAGARVTAVDSAPARLAQLAENLRRLGLGAEIIATDVLALPQERVYDAVLLDAPCSATGTIRRHPELPWIKTEKQIGELAAAQDRLLAHAARLVAPDGTLIFCTCSLEPEEGLERITSFLQQNREFERRPVRPEEIGGQSQFITPVGDLRTLPWMKIGASQGLDGFFAARLQAACQR